MNTLRGFTLTELLITLLISLILLAAAIPAYHSFVVSNRQASQVTQIIAAINLARSEAVLRHSIVTLCKSNDTKNCVGEWRDGWIIFVDKNGSGHRDTSCPILRVYPPMPTGSLLTWAGQRSSDYLQMDPSGGTHGQAGTFTYYADAHDTQKLSEIIISPTGRIRIVSTA